RIGERVRLGEVALGEPRSDRRLGWQPGDWRVSLALDRRGALDRGRERRQAGGRGRRGRARRPGGASRRRRFQPQRSGERRPRAAAGARGGALHGWQSRIPDRGARRGCRRMSNLIPTLRAIVREELTRYRMPELGVVSGVFAKESDSGDGNHQVSVTLRGSGVELQRAPVTVDRAGWSSLPREGDLVVVSFLDGD